MLKSFHWVILGKFNRLRAQSVFSIVWRLFSTYDLVEVLRFHLLWYEKWWDYLLEINILTNWRISVALLYQARERKVCLWIVAHSILNTLLLAVGSWSLCFPNQFVTKAKYSRPLFGSFLTSHATTPHSMKQHQNYGLNTTVTRLLRSQPKPVPISMISLKRSNRS